MIEFLKTTFPLLLIAVFHLAKRDIKPLFCLNSIHSLFVLYIGRFLGKVSALFPLQETLQEYLCNVMIFYAIVMQNRLLSYSIFFILSSNYSLWKRISDKRLNTNRLLLKFYLLLVKRSIRSKITEILPEQQRLSSATDLPWKWPWNADRRYLHIVLSPCPSLDYKQELKFRDF